MFGMIPRSSNHHLWWGRPVQSLKFAQKYHGPIWTSPAPHICCWKIPLPSHGPVAQSPSRPSPKREAPLRRQIRWQRFRLPMGARHKGQVTCLRWSNGAYNWSCGILRCVGWECWYCRVALKGFMKVWYIYIVVTNHHGFRICQWVWWGYKLDMMRCNGTNTFSTGCTQKCIQRHWGPRKDQIKF